MSFEITETGEIGNIRYELRCYSEIANVFEVVIFADTMGLTVCSNSGEHVCQAFIEGMKAGKCRTISSVANKNIGYSEYGGLIKSE